jgi:hypothetical protein
MKNSIITLLFILFISTISAQKKDYINKEGWTNIGKFTFLFNQSAFSNWASGGDNTVAGNATVNYTLNYKKNKFIWNNKLIASYGLTKSANTDFPKKTNDGININSMFGYDAENYWFYSFLMNFKTQFTKGYKYAKVDGVETRTLYTDFLSPGYFLIGPGMLWEKSNDFKINLAPATSKFVFVDKDFTLPNGDYFGVEEGENLRYEVGFSASLLYKFTIMENITMENIVALFSNYIDQPKNIDLNYTLDIDMKINKYFTANFIFQTVYDNNAYSGFQIREVLGIGANYNFER